MIALRLELSLSCPACDAPVALNALVQRRTCDRCQRPAELPTQLWSELLREPLLFAPTMHPNEQRDVPSDTVAGHVRRVLRREPPSCAGCQAPVALDDAVFSSAAGGWYACRGCGASMAVRALPQVVAGVRWFLDEERELLYGHEELPHEPVQAPCPSCSAPLRLDGSSRQVTCSFCRTQSQLPDAIWARLHPSRPVRRFFALLDGAADRPAAAGGARPAQGEAVAEVFPVDMVESVVVDAQGHLYLDGAAGEQVGGMLVVGEQSLLSLDGGTLVARWVRRDLHGSLALLDAERLLVWRQGEGDEDDEQAQQAARYWIVSTRDGQTLEKGKSRELAGLTTLSPDDDGSFVARRGDDGGIERFRLGGPPAPLFRAPEKQGFFGRLLGPSEEKLARYSQETGELLSQPAALPGGGVAFVRSAFPWEKPAELRIYDCHGELTSTLEVPLDMARVLTCQVLPLPSGRGILLKETQGKLFRVDQAGCHPFHPVRGLSWQTQIAALPDGRLWLLDDERAAWLISPDGRQLFATEAARRRDRQRDDS